ncbi:PD-(D/E)XK motif protein [Dactylosporangium sp. CA-139066]|uniref:PD-(D/E)XK motif protein n=1 Tax=Dactylosporangium sp. CA-139066 TaxID=3239930 RepID=UPI003D917B56
MNAPGARHLSPDTFTAHLRHSAPMDHPIPGEPRLILFTDPAGRRIGLRALATPGDQAVSTGLEHVSVRLIQLDGNRMIELVITDAALFTDAYPVLRAVADRIQVDKQPFTQAVTSTLRRLGHLLRPETNLQRATETGLLGELALFNGLARTLGPETALRAWRGALSEEHDFGLDDHDVEVKTTTREARLHSIESLTQLVPTDQRGLWLISFQVTVAGTGGTTLPDLITIARSLLAAGPDRDAFDDLLASAGWADRFATSCTTKWRLRNPPAAFVVDHTFPRITPAMLDPRIDAVRIQDVRYRVNLTGRPPDTPPDVVGDALQALHQELQ